MSEYERRENIIRQLSRFCPICGTALVEEERTVEVKIGFSNRPLSYTSPVKGCPNGHGTMDVSSVEGDFAPHAIFELNEAFFKVDSIQ